MIEPNDQKPGESPYAKIVGRTKDFVQSGQYREVSDTPTRRGPTTADARAVASSNKVEGQYKRQAAKAQKINKG